MFRSLKNFHLILIIYLCLTLCRSFESVEDDEEDHEIPKDVPTKPNYTAPGNWATPPPDKNIPLNFIPKKLYAQVRGTTTVRRLPRKKAIDLAESDEEKINVPRLKKVLTKKKINTVYTEEGYEDSAYDHAGHIKDVDFHQDFNRKLNLNDKENEEEEEEEEESITPPSYVSSVSEQNVKPVHEDQSSDTFPITYEPIWKQSGESSNDTIDEKNLRYNQSTDSGYNSFLPYFPRNRFVRNVSLEDTNLHQLMLDQSAKMNKKIIDRELDSRFSSKYPYYENRKVSNDTVLKYVSNPDGIPKKTLGGMEFYNSRDNYKHCDEIESNVDKVLPEKEEPSSGENNDEPKTDLPRLRGLGDKLDCLKAKYFDEIPLDNPLFHEKQEQIKDFNIQQLLTKIPISPMKKSKLRRVKTVRRNSTPKSNTTSFHLPVYQDVMGNIKIMKDQTPPRRTKYRYPRYFYTSKQKRSTNDENNTTRPVYTIMDRIRYSKPRNDTRKFKKVGKFTTTTTTTIQPIINNNTRSEPRYNWDNDQTATTVEEPDSQSSSWWAENYEFPWERRQRLFEERRKRKNLRNWYNKLRNKLPLDEDYYD